MRQLMAICRRELGGFFRSAMAPVVLVGFLTMTGLMFTIEPGNVFTRQFGVIVVTVIMYLMIIALLYVAQKLKSRINTVQ